MMDRRTFIGSLTVGLFAAPVTIEAQTRKVLGVLSELSLPFAACSGSGMAFGGATGPEILLAMICADPIASHRTRRASPQDLRAVEARGGPQLDSLAAELARLNPALIIALGSRATLAVKRVTTTIPVVMVGATDPVQLRLVASLARPGGHITGTSFLASEVVAKSVDLLLDVVPKASRVSVLVNSDSPGAVLVLRELQAISQTRGLDMSPVVAHGPGELTQALDLARIQRPEALVVLDDAQFTLNRATIISFANRERLPTVFHLPDYLADGGLLAYGPSVVEMYEQAGAYVGKILKGAKPADLPVAQPTKFHLAVNLKTAKALGLTIPQSLLLRADQVIE